MSPTMSIDSIEVLLEIQTDEISANKTNSTRLFVLDKSENKHYNLIRYKTFATILLPKVIFSCIFMKSRDGLIGMILTTLKKNTFTIAGRYQFLPCRCFTNLPSTLLREE